ncbi:MAG: DUF4870 domain-containing protein [Candidatus Kaiserbacteria bacterium]|nr:DUF4870 domain-containing protein [Candidatus Kaiserbacteria bacterium]MCB9816223.1 DUF4870 domain-containing protein [Candidatus Nomurabacteria bacterium]
MEPQNNNEQMPQGTEPQTEPTNPTTEPTAESTQAQTEEKVMSDVSEYRTFAILGYILPFLFFLPLLDDKTKNVPYVRFHANQQLILLIAGVAVTFVHSMFLVMLSDIGLFVYQLLGLALLALVIYGAYNAYQGQEKELPYIGHFRILK